MRGAWCRVPGAGISLAVDLAAMADAEGEDDDFLVLDVADDAVVADAIAPVAAELHASEGFADATRIFEFGDALSKERC